MPGLQHVFKWLVIAQGRSFEGLRNLRSASGCASILNLRSKYWHGPLVAVWHMLYKMAGHRCGKEVASIMDDSEKSRPAPDVVIYRLTENTLFF